MQGLAPGHLQVCLAILMGNWIDGQLAAKQLNIRMRSSAAEEVRVFAALMRPPRSAGVKGRPIVESKGPPVAGAVSPTGRWRGWGIASRGHDHNLPTFPIPAGLGTDVPRNPPNDFAKYLQELTKVNTSDLYRQIY